MNQVDLIGSQSNDAGSVEGGELPPLNTGRFVLWHGLPVSLLRSFMGRYSRFERDKYRAVRSLLRMAALGRMFEATHGDSDADKDVQTLLDFAYGLDDDIGQLAAVLSSAAATVEVTAVLREFDLSNDDGRGVNSGVETLMTRTYAMLVDYQATLSILLSVLAHRGVDVEGLRRRVDFVSTSEDMPAYPFALGDEPYIVPVGRVGDVSYGAVTADVLNDLTGGAERGERSALVRTVEQAQKHAAIEREYPRPDCPAE